jgi:prepilin-type N-terminal cleavage/methylation domain-containing protein
MRKGFTLIEMLVIITVFPLVLITADKLFKSLASDIPRSCRVPQENQLVLNMLDRLQQDIDQAKRLPESAGGYTTGDKLLLIEQADDVICYKIEDGQIARSRLENIDSKAPQDRTVWPLLDAEIQWRLYKINGTNAAVEIRTHINLQANNRMEEKLANSHLFFVGAF